jgi:type IV secretion system protein TrbI
LRAATYLMASPGAAGEGALPARPVATERQRLAAELKAARESGVMIQTARGVSSEAPELVPSASGASASETPAPRLALDAANDPGNQQRKADFLDAKDSSADVNPHALTAAASPYMLSPCTVIVASLITGLNSDLPGIVLPRSQRMPMIA